VLAVAGIGRATADALPGGRALTLHLQGCPWRCVHCPDPRWRSPRGVAGVPWEAVRALLQRRRGRLDGVAFAGGEPTAQAALGEAVEEARALGYRVALHTAGIHPERLRPLLPRLDWVALEVKAPWRRYDAVTGVRGSGHRAAAALCALLAGSAPLECRTAWHPALFPPDELYRLADDLAALGVRRWTLRACRAGGRPLPGWRTPDLARLRASFAAFAFRR
jgi:pyruvate formate lyase activating enzyme